MFAFLGHEAARAAVVASIITGRSLNSPSLRTCCPPHPGQLSMDSSAASKGAIEPPPPYRDNCTPPPLAGPSGLPSNHGSNFPFVLDEDSALLMKHQLRRRRVLRRLSYALGFILLVISILQNLSLVSCPLDDVSASTKRAKRREWKAQMKEHEVLVGQWATERELHEQEVYGWDLERLQWQEERQKWEQERKDEERHRKEVERKRQGVFWTDAVGDAHCSAYGTRVYRAALKDIPSGLNWLEVCSDMPNNVHGRLTDRPDECWRGVSICMGSWCSDG